MLYEIQFGFKVSRGADGVGSSSKGGDNGIF